MRGQRLFGSLTTAVISSLVCFALLETGLRITYGHPPRFLEPQVKHRPEPYGYKPLPHQQGVYTLDKPVRTNAFGFRDDEWIVPKPAGRLVMGDSFVINTSAGGWDLDNEWAFWRLAARALYPALAALIESRLAAAGD